MCQILLVLLALLVGQNDGPRSWSNWPKDILPPLVGAHVPHDLLETSALPRLLEELQQFRSVATAFSVEPRNTELITRERLHRGVRAMRAVGVSRILECRIALLDIVAACEHPHTEPYVLDALAALRVLGEPEEYFMDLLARAPTSYHRAAGAMIVLGWTPSDELVESATAATRACLRVGEMGVPYAAMQRNLGLVSLSNQLRRTTSGLLLNGQRVTADKHLLHALWGLHSGTTPTGSPPPASLLYSPSGNYARIQLWHRANDDPKGLRASIDAMTLFDFLQTEDDGFGHLDPEKRVAIFREQVLSLLPESVRQAELAGSSKD